MTERDAQKDRTGPAYVLAIDLGSGGPKVGIVSESGEVVASAVEKTSMYLLPNGGAEQDPEEWWQAVARASRKVVLESGLPPERIVAVGCTTQWSVIVPVDEAGKPLMNAVHWLDTRGAPYNRAISRGFPSLEGYGLTKLYHWVRLVGMPPTPGGSDALAHILFIKHERPEVYRKTYKFLEPMDFLAMRMTGRCASSQSNVFPLLLTDNRTTDCRQYSDTLIKLSGIDREKLPELLPSDGILGPLLPEIADELGLTTAAQVVTPANDDHTAAIGAGAVRDFDPVWVLGTSGFLACHVPRKKTDLFNQITTMPSPIPGRHLMFCEMGGAGKAVEFLLNNIIYSRDGFETGPAPPDLYQRIDRVAAECPAGSESVLFLPWLNGALVPEQTPYMRGAFLNLSNKTTRVHLARAVLEGIVFNLRWLFGPVRKFIGQPFPFLRLAGAGALSDTWAQIHADILGVPVHQLEDPRNANVRGAAFLAFDRLGHCRLEDVPAKVKVRKVYEPDEKNRKVYDKLYGQFRAAYKAHKPICKVLNRP